MNRILSESLNVDDPRTICLTSYGETDTAVVEDAAATVAAPASEEAGCESPPG